MNATLKTILATIGAIFGGILAFLLGRRNSNGRGVPGVGDNLDELGESARRATEYNNDLGEQLDISRDSAREIRDRNRDAKTDSDRFAEILENARRRSSQNHDNS